MTIKLLAFDMDGVLADIKDIHFHALNTALEEIDTDYVISYEDHLRLYDGKPTREKLKLLAERIPHFGRYKGDFAAIERRKQELTWEALGELETDERMVEVLRELSCDKYVFTCVSNSVRTTIELVLQRLGIFHFFSDIISNGDVRHPKPHPEGYMRAMLNRGVAPKETLIIEDSPTGRQAAADSGAYLLGVQSPAEVTYNNISKRIADIGLGHALSRATWQAKKANVLIPMAGNGSRFAAAGYTFPKPLIDVRGKPMIKMVVDNLGIDANYIFIVQAEHYEKYQLEHTLNLIRPNCQIVKVNGVTEGAACTALLARESINNQNPLLIANSDQFVEFDPALFMYFAQSKGTDGTILTFENSHPKWSYAKTDADGWVTEVAEKKPISNHATVGIYYWARGDDFVRCAERMIAHNKRVNNEFYIAPVYNELIGEGGRVRTFDADRMWGCGTPEDLNYFLNNYAGQI
jgi:HAD superfamily hydrolase (TIGR01509 family)